MYHHFQLYLRNSLFLTIVFPLYILFFSYCSTFHFGSPHSLSQATHWQSSLAGLVTSPSVMSINHFIMNLAWFWLQNLIFCSSLGLLTISEFQSGDICSIWAKGTSKNWHHGQKHKTAKAQTVFLQNVFQITSVFLVQVHFCEFIKSYAQN